MSTELAVRDVVQSLDDVQRVARLLAASGYFEAKGNGEQAIAQLATKVLAGREMGFSPFASVQGIHVIQGKPTVSANLMAAAVKASRRYDYRVRRMDADACEIEFFQRADAGKWESLGVSAFTLADGKAAGTQNLSKFARNMLFARAMSNGVRWYCPDVFAAGVYTPEELGAPVDGEGEIISAPVSVVEAAPQAAPAPEWKGWRSAQNAIDWAADQGVPDAADQYAALKEALKPNGAPAMFRAWQEHVEAGPHPEVLFQEAAPRLEYK